jgi:uncharacterized membrane protein
MPATVTLAIMADQSTQSITIDAQAAQVMAVIADFAAYPQWARSVKRCEVIESGDDGRARQVLFAVESGPIKDEYVLDYTWTADERVEWSLVRGQMQKGQEGSYVLVARGGFTDVTYRITIVPSVPMLGMIKRKVEKVVLDTALKELKKRVESGAQGTAQVDS